MPVDITFVDKVIHTKEEMRKLILEILPQLVYTHSVYKSIIDFWSRIVHSKSGPGTYSVLNPVNVLVRFPGAEFDVPHPCLCFTLDEKDIPTTSTTDASRIAWHSGLMTLSIEHPAWELTAELDDLCDPPMPCRVTVRVSGLQFKGFACVEKLRLSYGNPQQLVIFNEDVHTKDNIDAFICNFKDHSNYFHCNFPPDAARRIWFELVHARVGKNVFFMKMPLLIRLVTPEYDRSGIPNGSVAIFKKEVIEKSNFPSHSSDPDKCIGLYSSNLNMIITHGEVGLVPTKKELWSDIQPELSAGLPPPGCRVSIFFTATQFVSIASVNDINTMWYGVGAKPPGPSPAKSRFTDWLSKWPSVNRF